MTFAAGPTRRHSDHQPTPHRDNTKGAVGYTIAVPDEPNPATTAPGDVLLVMNTLAFSRGVQTLQRLRHGRFSWPSHSALIDSTTGDLIEAGKGGVVRSHIRDYQHLYRAYLHPGPLCPTWDPMGAVQFARDCADLHLSIYRRLFWLNAIALITEIQTPIRPRAVPTCSGFVANALQAGGFPIVRNTLYITPADLASRFAAPGPAAKTQRSQPAGRFPYL